MSEDKDADEIRVRVEQWRHFVSRRTVDDVAAGHSAVGSPPSPASAAPHHELHARPAPGGRERAPAGAFGSGNGVGHPYRPSTHGQRPVRPDGAAAHGAAPVEVGPAVPHRDAGRPFETDPVLAAARRAVREPHSGRKGRHRIQAIEIAVWLLTGAIVVAVSILFSRAMP